MKTYPVKVIVQLSTVVEIKATSSESAEVKCREKFYNGEIMDNVQDSKDYDWITTTVLPTKADGSIIF